MQLSEHSTIQLLKTLQKDEIDRLNKFISSPYFNTNKNISIFFNTLIKFYPCFDSKSFSKEYIYKQVYPDKLYNDSNFRWIISEITKLTEKFLAQSKFDNDVLMQNFYLTNNHLSKQRKEWLRKSISNTGSKLENSPDKDYIYFFHKYIHYTNEMSYDMIFKNGKKAKDLELMYEKFLSALISYINHFITGIAYDYLNASITFSAYYKNGVNKKINEIIKILDFHKIVKFIETDNEDNFSLTPLVLIINMYLNRKDKSHFLTLKKYLSSNENKISKSQLSGYYSKIISYCRNKILNNEDEEYFREELFNICLKFVEKKLYKEERTTNISITLFRIIIENSLELGKFEYVEKFIQNESIHLSEDQQNDSINFGKALLGFYKDEINASLEHLSKTDINYFVLDQKALRILLYIEHKYFYECANEIKSFKKFLSANKFLAAEVKKRWNHFIQISSSMLEHVKSNEKNGKTLIKDILTSQSHLYFKNWFIKKLNGL